MEGKINELKGELYQYRGESPKPSPLHAKPITEITEEEEDNEAELMDRSRAKTSVLGTTTPPIIV